MTITNITYKVPVPAEQADTLITTFALATNWNPESEITAMEHGRLALNKYMQNTIATYSANKAAQEARQNVLEATQSALGEITTTLEIETV